MIEVVLDYDNRTGRPPGRVVRTLGLVLPGVARVQRQVGPYADHWRAHNLTALQQPGRRLVALGDSMVQGVGATAPERGLAGELAARLARAGHTLSLVNLSATGARVADVVDQQLPVLSRLPGEGPPPVVLVLIGSNDLFAGAAHRDALPAQMARLVAALPAGAVVATLPQPRAAARAANVHLDEAAATGRLRPVDLRTEGPSSWRGLVAEDRFHPNDAGYRALADAFEPVLLDALDA